MDYSDKKVMIGLSAGINSAAVLVSLGLLPEKNRPQTVHIYYAHFVEHSPDSLTFVKALYEWAKTKFAIVVYKQTENSVLEFFEKSKMIPHPASSPCSRLLKILPMKEYMEREQLDIDLVGFVREEKQRATKMIKKYGHVGMHKVFPIIEQNNEWCFDIVKKEIGWYPAIYDLKWNEPAFVAWIKEQLQRLPDDVQNRIRKKLETNSRVFKHNNCLPCKNMYLEEMLFLEYAYPDYLQKAVALSERLKKYWGRQAEPYYTVFGRNDYEPVQCETCRFD